MKLHFKPMPWLTVIVAICLAILISLGTWQYQRLQWKTALLAEIEAVSKADSFKSLDEVQAAFEAGLPLDFARVEIQGEFAKDDTGYPEFHIYTPLNGGIGWRPYVAVHQGGRFVYVATDRIEDAKKDVLRKRYDPVFIQGYVRLVQKPSRFISKSSPMENRWFSFNARPEIEDWGKALKGQIISTDYYIDSIWTFSEFSPFELLPKRPEIRNNHLDYMLTWYSFALILLIIYFILHYRAGRLKFS